MVMSVVDQVLVLWSKAQQYAEVAGRSADPAARKAARRWLRRHGFAHYYLGEPLDDAGPATRLASERVVDAVPRDGADRRRVATAQGTDASQDRRRTRPSARSADAEQQTITITTRTTTTVTTKITMSRAGV